MTATKAALSALPSLEKFEMEDRKRSLVVDADDVVPSRKRVKDENGATMRMSDDKEKEVEVCLYPSPATAIHISRAVCTDCAVLRTTKRML